MVRMIRCNTVCLCALLVTAVCPAQQKPATFDFEAARAHEREPHRHEIPLEGIRRGFNQIGLTLTVSPAGDVLEAIPNADDNLKAFWPQVEPEVLQWKFRPFEQDSKAVTATVEEYLDLVPPERKPLTHVEPPVLKPDSKIVIRLERTMCYGRCPSYTVTLTDRGVVFKGEKYVAHTGRHEAPADPAAVRKLAQRFIDADFYSLEAAYTASVTDNPTYTLSISIDGHKKEVEDYVGTWVGMPAVVRDLEEAVDTVAGTRRWISERAH